MRIKYLGICALMVLILSTIGCSKPKPPMDLSDTKLFTKNTYLTAAGTLVAGDGYFSATITNLSNETKDYKIIIKPYLASYGYDENRAVGPIEVLGVRPGEKRYWECLLFMGKTIEGLHYTDWAIFVDGWIFYFT